MARQPFTGNKNKYTESELRNRGVCKYIDPKDQKWILKKAVYTNEGVWNVFTKLRDSFRALFTDCTGHVFVERAHSSAELMMDAFLVRRSNGENVQPPKEVVPVNAKPDENIEELLDPADFTDKNVSENEKLRWIFENIKTQGVTKEEAPSMGAYAMLHRLRENKDQLRDFDKTLWPKLLAKEDADKGGKLEDTGKETIDLIDRLLKAVESEA